MGAKFCEHDWKTNFLGLQRQDLWSAQPEGWLLFSLDWSNDYSKACQVELTCASHVETVVLCPIVVSRRVNPATDPLVSELPDVQLKVERFGTAAVVVHKGFTCMSSTATVKNASCTQHFVHTILEHYRLAGVTGVIGIILDTDNCAAQFKSGSAVAALRYTGRRAGVSGVGRLTNM